MKTTAFFIFFSFYAAQVSAQVTLDTTFADGGMSTFSLSAQDDYITAMAIQPDNKIVVCAVLPFNISGCTALFRYNPDGSLDESFGVNGIVYTAVVNPSMVSQNLKLQADGKILVAGSTAVAETSALFNFAVSRYNTDGSADDSFGVNGLLQTDFSNQGDKAHAVAVQADNKIIIAGETSSGGNQYFGVVRYLPDGTPDSSFGNEGKVNTGFGIAGFSDVANCIRLQPDGKIVIGGNAINFEQESDSDFAFLRLNADGSSDNSFGSGGKSEVGFGEFESLGSFTLTPDNEIVAVGYTYSETEGTRGMVLKLNADGDPDIDFGVGGRLIYDSVGTVLNSVARQEDGKLLCGGYSYVNQSGMDYLLIRLLSDGNADPGFNGTGSFTADFYGGDDFSWTMALQPDHKILLAGGSYASGTADTTILRIDADTSLSMYSSKDTAFSVFPNPASDTVTVGFELASDDDICMNLIDLNGKRIDALLKTKHYKAGSHVEIIRLPSTLSPGIYMLQLVGNKPLASIKLVIK